MDGVVDPVADCHTSREEELEAGTEFATDVFRSHFGGEHWDEDCGAACAEATDHATGIEETY